jgi:hypothetical protein
MLLTTKSFAGIGITGADRTIGRETDGRFEGQSSKKLMKEQTTQSWVPFGVQETAVVGDVEILYRVNEDGTLNLRVFFNREKRH